jgi:hypothetical protein
MTCVINSSFSRVVAQKGRSLEDERGTAHLYLPFLTSRLNWLKPGHCNGRRTGHLGTSITFNVKLTSTPSSRRSPRLLIAPFQFLPVDRSSLHTETSRSPRCNTLSTDLQNHPYVSTADHLAGLFGWPNFLSTVILPGRNTRWSGSSKMEGTQYLRRQGLPAY